ncbi:hypothetical protein BV372_28545 [Nostoc sp. T09]|uniref:hypothetical protein n=1 Tax=Nostoc sp. T09 TaxID=1932621 RepID=UPI000A3826A7|nr:hypothetical protein [Nostoc sp. T09]OUL24852.1 hypothetical protein BV372_28545 [Nostoc sp. T09]
MQFATWIHSAFLVSSITLLPGIADSQTTTNSSNTVNTATSANNLPNHSTNISYLKPFDTAFLAYQGELKQQGISSGATLISEYQTGKVTAVDVVKAAISAKKLPSQVLNKPDYLSAVNSQLTTLAAQLSY